MAKFRLLLNNNIAKYVSFPLMYLKSMKLPLDRETVFD